MQAEQRCVGREAELKSLGAALETLCLQGTGQFFIVSGTEGVGKTALLGALAGEAAVKGAGYRYGACVRGTDLMPLGAIETICADLCTEPRLGSMAAGLFTARGLPMPGAGRVSSASDDTGTSRQGDLYERITLEARRRRRYALFDGIVKLLRAASVQAPLVVALDDVHLADELLFEFLEYISYDLSGLRLMFVCARCDGNVSGARFERLMDLAGAGGAGVGEIELGPLHPEGLAAMLAGLYPGHRFTDDFVRVLFSESLGIPRVLEEMCTTLEVLDVIYKSADGWYNGQWPDLVPGEGLEGMVFRRLGRLSEDDIDLLEFLAGLPERFPLALLGTRQVSEYLGIQERTLLKRICRLDDPFRIFSLEGKTCRLRLPFLGRTILSDIPGRLAERDAEILAEGLEELSPQGASALTGTIADAYSRAGNDEKALKHLELASEYLAAYGAAGAAQQVMMQMLEGLRHRVQDKDTMARICEVQSSLAENYQLQDMPVDAIQNFERVLPLLGALGRDARRRRVELAVAFNRLSMGLVEEAESVFADRLGDEAAPAEERVVAALLLARALAERGQIDRAMKALKEAAPLVDGIGPADSGLVARLLVATGDLWLERGDNLKADGLFREALKVGGTGGTVRVDINCRLALLAGKTGRMDEAVTLLMDALAEAEQLSYLEGKARATEIMAGLKEHEDADTALDLLNKAYGYVNKTRSLYDLQRISARLGAVYRARDDLVRARFFLEKSYRILQKLGRKEQIVQTGLLLGELVLKENQLYEAERHFAEAWQLASAAGNRTGEAFALYGLGKAFLAQRKMDKAREHFDRAKELFETLGLKDRVEMVEKELRLMSL